MINVPVRSLLTDLIDCVDWSSLMQVCFKVVCENMCKVLKLWTNGLKSRVVHRWAPNDLYVLTSDVWIDARPVEVRLPGRLCPWSFRHDMSAVMHLDHRWVSWLVISTQSSPGFHRVNRMMPIQRYVWSFLRPERPVRFGLDWPSLEVCWLIVERRQHTCVDEEENQ